MSTYFETDEFETDEFESDEFESDEFESDEFEAGTGLYGEVDSPLSEVEELEWASQLLEISDEEELEEFLGKLFKKVAKGVGGIVRNPAFKALGGALKGIAKKALPMVGGALGSFVAPGVGTALGSKLGSMASKLFESEEEFEALEPGEAEFEVAKRYVRLAATAARTAATSPQSSNPQAVARKALMTAARAHAPALLRTTQSSAGYGSPRVVPGGRGRTRSGRWIRRGNKIIVLGV